jgi:hypothetical protein
MKWNAIWRGSTMHRQIQIASLLLLAALLATCNWPLSHLETEPLAAARTFVPAVEPGRAPVTVAAPAPVSPLATPGQGVWPERVIVEQGGPFSGQSLEFGLPPGYQVLEGVEGGCFLYHEALPGFMILYRAAGEPVETLASLVEATANNRRSEPPLEVDLGGLTFVGLFVETEAGARLFLAAADGWGLVVQGPVGHWPLLAGGWNRVLRSLTFKEGF